MVNSTSNTSGKQSYPMWEEGVADSLADKLGISYSDAQGIIESNEFYMAQAWAKGMNEEQTADFIDSKSTSMAKGGGVKVEVVNNNGSGIIINKLYNQWSNIKNQKQQDAWEDSVRNTKFGTYGTITIEDILKKFEFNNAPINSVMKEGFKSEIKMALNKQMAKGGNLRNSNVNVTNEMRGEDSDEYGTFEIYKDGGNIEVSIINSGESYDRDRYEWLLGDFDNDGLTNSNDNKPLNKKQHEPIDSPNIAVGLEKLIALKKSLDSNMYSFVEELKNVAPDKSKIYARTKTPYSILDKLVKKRLGTLTDLIGTTIVTNDKKELDAVKRFVESGKLGRITELEDMYENPKQGYRAYHFLIDRNGTSIELQLKTKRQKAINELSHEPYKQGKLNGDMLVKMTELANRADEGDKAAIKEYNEFMEQPDIEKVFYAERGGYMAKGGDIDKTLISSIPKRRRADRKYTHFAVRKSDNKILNGWDYSKYDSEDLNSDKYHYFYYDMEDMDVPKNEYTIKKAQTLIREGINPFDFDNWKNLDYSNDKMAHGGEIEVGDWVAARKGNARGQVYDIDAIGIKLQDKYGNKGNTRYLKSQLKHSSKPRYEEGGMMEDNEVLSFFNNIDYSKLPPAFSDYIKKEILTDDDLQYLSPREPIFLEIKSKVEGYSNKPTTTQAPTETGVSDEKKKVLKEIADLEGLKDLVSGDELIKINKELDDLNGLLPIL